jgi:integrase
MSGNSQSPKTKRGKGRGVRRKGNQWEAYVKYQGAWVSKRFPLDEKADVIQTWREATLLQLKQRQPSTRVPHGTFADDAATYLKCVASMTSYRDRERHVNDWVLALGAHRPRHTITTVEIRAALEGWKKMGPHGRPLSPQSIRHRRNALSNLFLVLDGPEAPNPVRPIKTPQPPPNAVREVPPDAAFAILDTMQPSASRARLKVLYTTSLPQATIKRLAPNDIDLENKTVTVSPRRKGAGAAGRVIELSSQAVAAFREFISHDAFGTFSNDSLRKCWKRACARLVKQRPDLVPVLASARPYDLRHAFGVGMYRVTGDLATVGRLMLHSTPTLTQRYAAAANAEVDRRAVDRYGEWLSHRPGSVATSTSESVQSVPTLTI